MMKRYTSINDFILKEENIGLKVTCRRLYILK